MNYVTVRPIRTKSVMIFGCSTSFDNAVLVQSRQLKCKESHRVLRGAKGEKSCLGSWGYLLIKFGVTKQGNYSLRRPPKLIVPQAVIRQ